MSDIFVPYVSTYTRAITAFLYCRRSVENANKTMPAATNLNAVEFLYNKYHETTIDFAKSNFRYIQYKLQIVLCA